MARSRDRHAVAARRRCEPSRPEAVAGRAANLDAAYRISRPAGTTTRDAVCLCADRAMLIPALFVADAVKSTLAVSGDSVDVIVFAEPSELTDVHRRWMEEQVILLCDDLDLARLRGVARLEKRLSVATMVKLVLAEHLAGRYDRILYLDADVTIHDNVAALFALDTGDFALAAVPSGRIWADQREAKRRAAEEHFRELGMSQPYRYLNSGVLYIDVDKWNRVELGARALAFVREHPDLCRLPDEDGLNGVLDGSFAQLSPIWNMRPGKRHYEVTHEIARPVVVHYIGVDKPWRRYGYRKRLFPDLTAYRLYESFLSETPWPTWLDEQWSARDLGATVAWEALRVPRALVGRSGEPSSRQRRDYVAAFRQYCAEEPFVDVDQHIVLREDGRLRLNRRPAAAPA